jgi:DNA-binding LytR/AlgR family response regulator
MNLSCAIIDDEPLAVSLLESYVKKTPFLTLQGKYNSAILALPELNANPVDLLFLDIQMPELNGMEFSRMLSGDTRIIFTTAFEQYALDSYKVNALDYLLKPISYPDFLQSAQKALQWIEMVQNRQSAQHTSGKSEPESIFIKTERRLVRIDLDKILYIEGLKDYVKIYIEGQTHPVLSLMTMKAMEDLLPPSRFVRVHRSFIVQPEKIKIIERSRIVYGKEYIPISDSYKDKFNEFLSRRSIFTESNAPG